MSGFGFHCGMVPYTPPPPVCRENVVFITKAWSSGIGRARRCVHLPARFGFVGGQLFAVLVKASQLKSPRPTKNSYPIPRGDIRRRGTLSAS